MALGPPLENPFAVESQLSPQRFGDFSGGYQTHGATTGKDVGDDRSI
jgi:hypothetical protein